MRKRGFSDIIAVVFFVVTALVVFVILYNSYMGFVRNSSGKMENQFLSLLDRFFATDSTTTLAGGVIHLDGTYEGCFVELEINEVKTGDILDETGNVIGADIDFNLEGQENLYGIYSGQVDYYDSEMPGDYVLNTYDSSGNLLSKYSAYSGRFIFYDSFDETTNESGGGIIETEEAVISVIIPYDERIDNVKIENNAEEFNLGVNAGNFACERICKIGGEEISEEDSCCAGFIPFEFNDVFKCSNQ
ncbi:MAG: hypothetical protein KKB21_00600, partial [Nanoarchaeota archaeon]|nr:hypothetical protein [Nanoarchaeota archaeon]